MPKSCSSPPLRLRSFILYGVYSRSCCKYLCLSYIILFYLVYYRYKYNIMREIWSAAALRQQTAAISVKSWQRRCRPRIVSGMSGAMRLARSIACSRIVTGLALFRADPLFALVPCPHHPMSPRGVAALCRPARAPGERADSHPLTRFWKRPSPRSKPIPPSRKLPLGSFQKGAGCKSLELQRIGAFRVSQSAGDS
jgi:hypothetical protein